MSMLLILEGPDRAGKTTLARKLAALLDADVVHGTPFNHLAPGYLARTYAEMMMPALLNHRNIIMDRSWLSEPIYGAAFRGGTDRIGEVHRRMLERMAMRAGAVVILCLPPLASVLEGFAANQGAEYLKSSDQLREVYRLYDTKLVSDLPLMPFDYTTDDVPSVTNWLSIMPTRPHPWPAPSGGSLTAPFVVVGEAFADHRNEDPFYRVPFVSFSKQGCSHWLTEQLNELGPAVNERSLLWANADFDPEQLALLIGAYPRRAIFTLGERARQVVAQLKIRGGGPSAPVYSSNHPQHHKRFKHDEPFAFIDQLRGMFT